MQKIYAGNFIYDLREWAAHNRGKLIFCALLFLVGLALGIRNGITVSDVDGYLIVHDSTALLLITGKRNVVGYFFVKLLLGIVILTIFLLLSNFFLTAVLGFAVVFFYSYYFGLYLTLYLLFFKISVLPYVLFCMIPCFFAGLLLYAFCAVMCVCRGMDVRRYGRTGDCSLKFFTRKLILPALILLTVCLLESLLAFFLTIGITA